MEDNQRVSNAASNPDSQKSNKGESNGIDAWCLKRLKQADHPSCTQPFALERMFQSHFSRSIGDMDSVVVGASGGFM